jgi:hypothetical protein
MRPPGPVPSTANSTPAPPPAAAPAATPSRAAIGTRLAPGCRGRSSRVSFATGHLLRLRATSAAGFPLRPFPPQPRCRLLPLRTPRLLAAAAPVPASPRSGFSAASASVSPPRPPRLRAAPPASPFAAITAMTSPTGAVSPSFSFTPCSTPLPARDQLHRRLVRLDLGEDVALADLVALVLQPPDELPLLHRRRERLHVDLRRHPFPAAPRYGSHHRGTESAEDDGSMLIRSGAARPCQPCLCLCVKPAKPLPLDTAPSHTPPAPSRATASPPSPAASRTASGMSACVTRATGASR